MIINVATPQKKLTRDKRKAMLDYLNYHERYRTGSGIFRKNEMFRIFEEGVEITVFEGIETFPDDWMDDCRDFLESVFHDEEIGISCSRKHAGLRNLKGVKVVDFRYAKEQRL